MTTKTTLTAIVLVAALSAFSVDSAQAQVSVSDARRLVELAKQRNTSLAVAEVQAQSPSDARLPYLVSLTRVERHDYAGAIPQVKRALELDPSNLDAWKTRIWLSLSTKDFDDASRSMEWLATRMPAQGATPAAEQTCVSFCGFMGKSFGYMAGPQGDRATQAASAEQRVASRLSGSRKSAFEAGRRTVVSDFANRMSSVDQSRKLAQQQESRFRSEELARLDEENRYANSELAKIEDTRLSGRELTSNERNIIASTREQSAGGTLAGSNTNYRKVDLRNPMMDKTAKTPTIVGHRFDRRSRLHRSSGLASGYVVDRGLGNAHYLNVNQREAIENERLEDRERDMQRRLQRIAKDKSKQINRPNAGMTASVRVAIAKAKALNTYLAFPVSTEIEIASLIASYR